MIFNTWTFGLFALLALTIYWLLVPQRLKPYYLVFIGCVFYSWAVPSYLILVLTLGGVTFGIGHLMLRARADTAQRKFLIVVGVALIVAVLALFKYSRFFASTLAEVARHDVIPVPHFLVPLAISFFTFEFVHVLVDVYLGKITRLRAIDFAVFTMFFPTMVAGPIKRYQTFAPQVAHIELPPDATIALNLYRVMVGLAKKFILADSMSVLTGPLTDPTGLPYGRLDYIVSILAYAAKIYFDFSAYSDIAIGIAALLGLRVPENFARPYWAQNISEFWRRWHMSLSSWIRDYVFIPLGGSRRPALVTAVNLFIAMAIAGLWHGAAWTFVVWGMWHGAGLAAHRIWSTVVVPANAVLRDGNPAIQALSIALTFAFVAVGWILFAAPSFDAALTVTTRAFGP